MNKTVQYNDKNRSCVGYIYAINEKNRFCVTYINLRKYTSSAVKWLIPHASEDVKFVPTWIFLFQKGLKRQRTQLQMTKIDKFSARAKLP